jgi:hypothetical protein
MSDSFNPKLCVAVKFNEAPKTIFVMLEEAPAVGQVVVITTENLIKVGNSDNAFIGRSFVLTSVENITPARQKMPLWSAEAEFQPESTQAAVSN